MQYSFAGGSGLFKIRQYIKSPKQALKYDLSSMNDVIPAGSKWLAGISSRAATEQLWLQSTNDLWRGMSEHARITTICAAAFFFLVSFA